MKAAAAVVVAIAQLHAVPQLPVEDALFGQVPESYAFEMAGEFGKIVIGSMIHIGGIMFELTRKIFCRALVIEAVEWG